MKDIITFDEYNNSLDSSEYVDLIQLMQNRLSMPRQEIDKVIDNHFNFGYSIKKNYKSFLNSIKNIWLIIRICLYLQQLLVKFLFINLPYFKSITQPFG